MRAIAAAARARAFVMRLEFVMRWPLNNLEVILVYFLFVSLFGGRQSLTVLGLHNREYQKPIRVSEVHTCAP